MEKYKATIERKKDNYAVLKLALDTTVLDIVLTEDKPIEVKEVFNKLLMQLKEGEFCFELEDTKEDLYFHICKVYISQLNSELKGIFKELEANDLLKPKLKTQLKKVVKKSAK
jgi:hypothetical protein